MQGRARKLLCAIFFSATGIHLASAASAQSAGDASLVPGGLIVLSAQGEVRMRNDEVRLLWMVQEQDKDAAVAASRVNQKMKRGMEVLRQADPSAVLSSRGYSSTPRYADSTRGSRGELLGWRVSQHLELTTRDLERLPALVAAGQSLLALQGLGFGLSESARKALDEQRLTQSWNTLRSRLAAVLAAMGKKPQDAVLESVEFDQAGGPELMARSSMKMNAAASAVEEPSFEPGETELPLRAIGKFRLK